MYDNDGEEITECQMCADTGGREPEICIKCANDKNRENLKGALEKIGQELERMPPDHISFEAMRHLGMFIGDIYARAENGEFDMEETQD